MLKCESKVRYKREVEKVTIIEFYDKSAIENVAGALLFKPEQVVFVGDDQKKMKAGCARYEKILSARGIQTEFFCRSVNRNNLKEIVCTLSDIVASYDDCVFDLTGGEELCLVAVGIVMKLFEGKVKCHRFNFNNDTVKYLDSEGKICKRKSVDISVHENVSICGGEIVTDPSKMIYTYDWDLSDDFCRDIEAVWSICRKNAKNWNLQIGCLSSLCEIVGVCDGLKVAFNKEKVTAILQKRGRKFTLSDKMLNELQKKKLISELSVNESVSFKFKSEQVKKCLTTAGQALELIIASRMRNLKDEDGKAIYNDVKVGVVIDWDGESGEEKHKTLNEIDIMAIKGVIPIFISCKNGDFNTEELYKLNTVSSRFGGKYAKRALVTTALDRLGSRAEHLRARMADMRIRRIENPDEMDDIELDKILRSLWRN